MQPKARITGLVVENVIDEYVVYDTRNHKAHNLNPTAAWIWNRCDGSRDVEQLISEFAGSSTPMSLKRWLHPL